MQAKGIKELIHHPMRTVLVEKEAVIDCAGLRGIRERRISASIFKSFRSAACVGV
jgi:hypothetical protein